MPDSLHSPYGQSTIQPKLLVRWLDVNSLNKKLDRIRGYLGIPAVGQTVYQWAGYSQILTQFNFSVSNNVSLILSGEIYQYINPLSLTQITLFGPIIAINPSPPTIGNNLFGGSLTTVNYVNPLPNQLPSIYTWTVRDSTGKRYVLNSNGETWQCYPLYTNQPLYGPFITIEVWDNINTATLSADLPGQYYSTFSLAQGVNVYTSLKGTIDYRWGTDFQVGLTPYQYLLGYGQTSNYSGGVNTGGLYTFPITFNKQTCNY
jgi:hypothetical protein